jgi:hypothetical protein
MSLTYITTHSVSAGGTTITGQSSVTNTGESKLDETLGAAQTNTEYDISFTQARVKAVVIKSAVACTIKTNSSSVPDDTISVAANVPIVWDTNSPFTCPFTANVTKFYITNTTAGAFQCYVLWDPTP